MARAIRYAFHHWDGLILFANDGCIEMDTNTVERSIRPLALNRKNALFAGHDRGADHWATVASLIETCKLNGVDPQAYLASALSRLVNGWPMRRIDELMPWANAIRQNATATSFASNKPSASRHWPRASSFPRLSLGPLHPSRGHFQQPPDRIR